MDGIDPTTDGLVVFRNSQGQPARGTLIRLTRNAVVFEVYNPYSIVQLSEVLSGLEIRRRDRVIYQGKAVVSNMVNTGLVVIVSATLVDEWSNLAGLQPGSQLREEVADFVQDWSRNYQNLKPDYELSVSKLRNFLQSLSGWLQQGEALMGIDHMTDDLSREFGSDVEVSVNEKFNELFFNLETQAREIPPEQVIVHKAFARRELHPLVMQSPFLHRIFTKPLGYAGDYEMVNMILRDAWEGQSTYARLLNSFFLRTNTAQAHRNRIRMLTDYLRGEAQRVVRAGNRKLRVLNIGCGPAEEVQRLFREEPKLSERCDFTLMDFNEETLEYAENRIRQTMRANNIDVQLTFVHQSINDLLKKAAGRETTPQSTYDMVYCAGLFDYLSDRICNRLVRLFYNWTDPQGLVLVTNVHARNPDRGFMEHLFEWYLILRDEKDLLSLASKYDQKQVIPEETGANIFLEVRKPVEEAQKAAS